MLGHAPVAGSICCTCSCILSIWGCEQDSIRCCSTHAPLCLWYNCSITCKVMGQLEDGIIRTRRSTYHTEHANYAWPKGLHFCQERCLAGCQSSRNRKCCPLLGSCGHWIVHSSEDPDPLGPPSSFFQLPQSAPRGSGSGVAQQLNLKCVDFCFKNHHKERLLDQAQSRASYTPPFLGSFA